MPTILADALCRLGSIERHLGDPTAALKWFAEAATVAETFLKTTPDKSAMRCRLGESFTRDAWAQADLNQTDDALRSLQQAMDVLEPLSRVPSGVANGATG